MIVERLFEHDGCVLVLKIRNELILMRQIVIFVLHDMSGIVKQENVSHYISILIVDDMQQVMLGI